MTDAEARPPLVLVVDDEALVASSIARALRAVASDVVVANDAGSALELLNARSFDVVVSDIHMPGMTGLALVDAVRARDLDVPVILITGAPSVETAASAVEVGAFRYLAKPFELASLLKSVQQAAQMRALSRARTEAPAADRARLEHSFRRALVTLRMAYQPVVESATQVIAGHEALLRHDEPTLPAPLAVLDAAQKLGALHLLGRRIRTLIATDMERQPARTSIFVNLHAADLADADLYDPSAPLSKHAERIALELTERASLEGISDLAERLAKLRRLGYRVAVDDLGSGYAGLSYFASVRPEIVKIDMSLVRGAHADPVRQRVITSVVQLTTDLGIQVVAEGVETVEERDTVVRLGCGFVQGHLLAEPGPPFPTIRWR